MTPPIPSRGALTSRQLLTLGALLGGCAADEGAAEQPMTLGSSPTALPSADPGATSAQGTGSANVVVPPPGANSGPASGSPGQSGGAPAVLGGGGSGNGGESGGIPNQPVPVAEGGEPAIGGAPSNPPQSGAGGTPALGGAPSPGSGASPAEGGGSGLPGVAGAGEGQAGSGSDEVAMSTGCGSATPPESGRFSIEVDGTEREYILAVPSDYDSDRPYRLVFGWHPLGGSAQQVAGQGLGGGGYYGLAAEADGAAIFVAPEGLPFNGDSLGWANTGGRDIAFLRGMLARFSAELCVDENRVFSTGFSFGGMMSFAVGCALGSEMRAIAPMAGNIMVSGCEAGDEPVAVMGFHGDDDTVVSIDGGRAGRDVFVERNGCDGEAPVVEPSWCDGLGQNEQPCSCTSHQGCDAGYPVIWCEFNGPHTPAPNSAATIWEFFAQF